MNVFRKYAQYAAAQSFVTVTLAHVEYVSLYVRLYYEYGILVASNVEALSLSYGVELGAVVHTHALAPRVCLVPGLAQVFLSAAVALAFEDYGRVVHRLGEFFPFGVVQSAQGLFVPLVAAGCGIRGGFVFGDI